MAGKTSDGIPTPKRSLCSPDVVSLNWQKCHRIGAGLINMGNSCFLNSVLQCLTYTPPLVNFLLSHQHKEQCKYTLSCLKKNNRDFGKHKCCSQMHPLCVKSDWYSFLNAWESTSYEWDHNSFPGLHTDVTVIL